jgi:glutathione S-transferase
VSKLPTITTFRWVPEFARGYVHDIRLRWAFEEEGLPYAVDLIDGAHAKSAAHRYFQPFGQIPTYRDDEVEIFESGAIAIRIAEQGGKLLPADINGRMRAIQWVIAALNSVEPVIVQFSVVEIFEADCAWSPMRRDKVVADIKRRLADLENALGDKAWLDGDAFTVGDLMMISVLGDLRKTDMLADFPRLAAYVARGEDRPAYVKAMADHLAVYASAKAA